MNVPYKDYGVKCLEESANRAYDIFQILRLDGNLMGSINTLPNYVKYYEVPPTGNAGTGIVFAIFNVWNPVPT
ncbi:hypothetical protein RJZ56_001680 [Blastomyces dermatitidis]